MTSKKLVCLVPNKVVVAVVNDSGPDLTLEQLNALVQEIRTMGGQMMLLCQVATLPASKFSFLKSYDFKPVDCVSLSDIETLAAILPRSHFVTYRVPARTDFFERTVLQWGYQTVFEITDQLDVATFNQLVSNASSK